MELAEKLKQIRTSKGWSQAEMGEVFKISQQVYSNYENGVNQKYTPEMIAWIQDNFVNQPPAIELEEVDSKVVQAIIRIEAKQAVQDSYIAEIYSKLTGVPATRVLRDMEQMGEVEVNKLLDKLK